jgi:hypothetical protein
VTSPTTLRFTTPAHAAGTVDLFVTTDGLRSGALSFTYVQAATSLAFTGSNTKPGIAIGGSALTAGLLLLGISRRRRLR